MSLCETIHIPTPLFFPCSDIYGLEADVEFTIYVFLCHFVPTLFSLYFFLSGDFDREARGHLPWLKVPGKRVDNPIKTTSTVAQLLTVCPCCRRTR